MEQSNLPCSSPTGLRRSEKIFFSDYLGDFLCPNFLHYHGLLHLYCNLYLGHFLDLDS